jgi:hypothetical protein
MEEQAAACSKIARRWNGRREYMGIVGAVHRWKSKLQQGRRWNGSREYGHRRKGNQNLTAAKETRPAFYYHRTFKQKAPSFLRETGRRFRSTTLSPFHLSNLLARHAAGAPAITLSDLSAPITWNRSAPNMKQASHRI